MTGTGSLTELIAKGALDAYLTQNATFTWWKTRYNKHTMFAMESIKQVFQTQVAFGSEAQLTVNRMGDLIFYVYVAIELPGLEAVESDGMGMFPQYMTDSCAPCAKADQAAYMDMQYEDGMSVASDEKMRDAKNQWLKNKYGSAPTLECCEDVDDTPDNLCPELGGVWAHWTNNVGQHLVRSAKIVIGGTTIDTLHNDLLFIWEELSGRAGRRLQEMCLKRFTRAQLICDSRQKRLLYVPLPFWFCQNSGSALPLASLQFHGVQLHVDFSRLEHCIVTSGPKVKVLNVETGTPITANDLKASLEITYIYLEMAERDRFSNGTFEVLITQHQSMYQQINTPTAQLSLTFNHPVSELLFAVRRQCHERCNNWYNFSSIDNRDTIQEVELFLNNQSRFGRKPGIYFRTCQPYQHHSNIPDAFIYSFSFALHPESVEPSGSCNFSRVDHVDLKLTLADGLAREQCTVMVFARSFNILRFKEGLTGLAFAN